MADILIRGLDKTVLERLKARARRNGRSLQSELHRLLEQAAGVRGEAVEEMFERWSQRFAGRRMARSTTLIREDRRR